MLILGRLLWTTTGSASGAPPPAAPADPLGFGYTPSGGAPAYDVETRTRREISRARRKYGLKDRYATEEAAANAIREVALRQAIRLEKDKQRQFDELKYELALLDIAIKKKYIAALDLERTRLIDIEIGLRITNQIRDEEEIMVVLLLMSAVAV